MTDGVKVQEFDNRSVGGAHAKARLSPVAGAFEMQENMRNIDVDSIILMVNVFIDEERKHIAREMHDEFAQILTALGLHLALMRKRVGTQLPNVVDDMDSMKTLIERALGSVRQITSYLHPQALERGLIPAIECLCHEFTELTQVVCRFHAPDKSLDLDKMRSLDVFRMVQESLTNITRYAKASRVDIRIGRHGNELRVQVRDNGCGFDPDELQRQKNSFGLHGMHERAIALGGHVTVSSQLGRGTVVKLTLPLGPALNINTQ